MAERIDTPFTNEHFVAYCLRMVGHPYWFGTCAYKATNRLLSSKSNQYPSHYTTARTSRYKQDIANKEVVADCIGGVKGYAWTGSGIGVLESIGTDKKYTSKYGSNGCPDKSASGMFEYCKKKGMDWGTIGTLPEIVGLALFTDGHIGYYVGGGYAVEWHGFNYGCVKTKVKERTWKHWAKLPFINYGDAPITPAIDVSYTLGSRSLKKGSLGGDVRTLQELLNQLAIISPALELDGNFGAKTEAAVKTFQKKYSLKQDGIYGDETHKALMGAVADDDESKKVTQEGTDEQPADAPVEPSSESPDRVPAKVTIVCSNGTVNIRKGNSTAFSRITAVKNGTVFTYIATAANGWHAVLLDNEIGWVSAKYSRAE